MKLETRSEQILSSLRGSWKIERTITHRFPIIESYQATGSAKFSLEEVHTLHYEEEVKLRNLRTKDVFQSTQQYVYRYDAVLDTLTKHFSDGRLFYKLEISDNGASGYHLCQEDHYSAEYLFESQENFSLTYLVKGPRKDYTMQTQYILR